MGRRGEGGGGGGGGRGEEGERGRGSAMMKSCVTFSKKRLRIV